MNLPKPATLPEAPPPSISPSMPIPLAGGSWIHDEETGTLTRAMPPVQGAFEPSVQDPVQPASKEA